MSIDRRSARINVKALLVLLVVFVLLCGGLVGGHYVRKKAAAAKALAAGRQALADGNLNEACRQLRRYLVRYPDDAETLRTYADTLLSIRPRTQEHVANAIIEYRRLLRLVPQGADICNRIIRLYWLRRDYQNVIWTANHWLDIEPDNLTALVFLARAQLADGSAQEAIKTLDRIDAVESNHVAAGAIRAGAILRLDDGAEVADRARACLDRVVAAHPESAAALLNRARFHRDTLRGRKSKDLAAARRDVEQASRLPMSRPQDHLDLGQEWLVLGEFERALAALAPAKDVGTNDLVEAGLDPDKYLLDWNLLHAAAVRMVGTQAEIVSAAEQALAKLSGGYRSAFLETAIDLYLRGGDTEAASRALDEYRKVVTGVPDGPVSFDERLSILAARIAFAENRPYEVIDLLLPTVAQNPNSYAAQRLLGQSFILTHQRRRAMQCLRQCLSMRPDDDAVKSQLVKEYLRERRWGDAVRTARTLGRSGLETRLLWIEASMRGAIHEVLGPEVLNAIEKELVRLRREHPESSAVRMLMAALLEQRGQPDGAIEALRSAIVECADSLDPSMQLARLYQRMGRPEDAIATCRTEMARHPEDPKPWILAAELLRLNDRAVEAEALLGQAGERVATEQDRYEIEMASGRLMLRLGRRSEAIARFEQVARAQPGHVQSRVALLELPEIIEDAKRAQPLIDELQSIEGARSGILWRLHQVRTWLAQPDWRSHEQTIIEMLDQCMHTDPEWERPVLLLGRTYERLGDVARAETVYRGLLDIKPNATAVVDRLLRLLENQNRVAEAREVLSRVPSDLPGLTDHRIGIATATGEFETAIRELRTLVDSDPKNAQARIVLARLVYRELRDAGEALRLIDEAEKIAPDNLAICAVRAYVLLSEDQGDRAEAVLDRAVAERDDFGAYLLRAQFHVARGDKDAAEADYKTLAKQDETGVGYELLGRYYYSEHRLEDAIGAWREGAKVAPDRPSLQRLLMRAYLVHPDKSINEQGVAMLDDMIKASPDDAELLAVRARLLLADGGGRNRAEAKRLLGRVVELDGRAISACLALVQLEVEDGELERAKALVTQALGFSPGQPDLLLVQAQLERVSGGLVRARDLANIVVGMQPERADAYGLLADIAFLEHRFAEALSHIDNALKRDPRRLSFQLKRAAILESDGQPQQAIDSLAEFVRRQGQSAPLPAILALSELCCRHQQGCYDRWMGEAAARAGESSEVIRAKIRCLGIKSAYERAAEMIEAWKAKHPEDTAAVVDGAAVLTESKEERWIARARSWLVGVCESEPTNVAARLAAARAAFLAGDMEATCDLYEEVLSLDPQQSQAINDLAWVLAMHRGQPEQAVEWANRGVSDHYDDPHLRDTRGVILTLLGRLTPAEQDLRMAIDLAEARRLFGTQARAWMHLADVYEKRNEPDRRREALRAALAIDEEHNVLENDERAAVRRDLGQDVSLIP